MDPEDRSREERDAGETAGGSATSGSNRRPDTSKLFRQEALEHHVRARRFGDVVRRPPRWTRFAYPGVVALAVVGVVALVAGRAPREARGTAVVRASEGVGAGFVVHAFLPARFLADLRPGLPLRVEPAGYPGTSVETTVQHAADRPLAPGETCRLLEGGAVPPDVEIASGVVEVRAVLPAGGFRAADGEHPWVDGMAVTVEVALGSEPMIYNLFPGLRAAVSD